MENMKIARTILEQLGGNRFSTMTGAKGFLALDNGLSFALPGGGGFCKNGINKVSIVLDPSDTYTVTFGKTWKGRFIPVSEHAGVYDDMLQELFTKKTGLHAHF